MQSKNLNARSIARRLLTLAAALPIMHAGGVALAADEADPHAGHEHHHTQAPAAAASSEASEHVHGEHAGHTAGHAPIGVMGDHVHPKGEWMASYRYMHMGMNQNYDGTSEVSTGDILADGWMVAPESMDMDMHMFGLMYAPLDRVTLMAMIPFITKSMDHVTGSGGFTTESKGVGDLKLSALIGLWNDEHHGVHAQIGFSSPTGSIDEKDAPLGPTIQLPYPMQIGSGTFDLLFGATYTGHTGKWSWGSQASATVRLGENDNDYRFGHEYEVTGWGAFHIVDAVSTSFRLAWNQNFNVEGADPALNPAMVPTADPNLRAGRRLDALFGIDFIPAHMSDALGATKGARLSLEGGLPAYQNLDGPQLGVNWLIIAGVQYAF